MAGAGSVPLKSLTAEQLENVRGDLEKDVGMLEQNVKALAEAQQRLVASQESAGRMAEMGGMAAMVPFTDGIYLPGKIGDTSRLLVDLGTGYFVEKTPEEAQKYFGRRLAIVKENIEKASGILSQKQRNLEAVQAVYRSKAQDQSSSGSKS